MSLVFDVKEDSLPALRIIDPKNKMAKYKYEDSVTTISVSSIKEFIDNF